MTWESNVTYGQGYPIWQYLQAPIRGLFCDNRRNTFGAGGDGRPVELGHADLYVRRLIGVWHSGGLWNSSHGICFDAPAGGFSAGQSAARSGEGAVKTRSQRSVAS